MVLDEERLAIDGDFGERISEVIVSTRPSVVITHLPFDYHREHRIAYEVVREAVEWAAHTTTYDDPWIVERLLLMEVNTLIPSPHVAVDISDVMERKVDAMDCYASQLSKFPWGYYREFNTKKAELRGVQAGCRYAEADEMHEKPHPNDRISLAAISKCLNRTDKIHPRRWRT